MASEGFFETPTEIVDMILGEAVIEPQIIEIQFDREPQLRLREWGGLEHIIWSYRMQARNPSALLSVDKHTREQFLRNNPDVLQLFRGPKIHFNAERDTIYFDSESFLNFWHYVTSSRWLHIKPPSNAGTLFVKGCLKAPGTAGINLKGLQLIKTLGWFSTDPATLHLRGLADVMMPQQKALTGLTNIRLLGDRGYHLVGRAPETFDGAARQLDKKFLWAVQQKINALRNSKDWNGDQIKLIDQEWKEVIIDTDEFCEDVEAAPAGVIVTPD